MSTQKTVSPLHEDSSKENFFNNNDRNSNVQEIIIQEDLQDVCENMDFIDSSCELSSELEHNCEETDAASNNNSIDDQNDDENVLPYEALIKFTESESGQENDVFPKVFICYKNELNLCWLHCSIVLLTYNKSARVHIENVCLLNFIIKGYKIVISKLNQDIFTDVKLQAALTSLNEIRRSVLKFLKPRLKYTIGIPDSAFQAVSTIINENPSSQEAFNIEYSIEFQCLKCLRGKRHSLKKTIITLNKVRVFDPLRPGSSCCCSYCKAEDQMLYFKYTRVSDCLVFHFENFDANEAFTITSFHLSERVYRLTGVILRKRISKQSYHFLTWLRDPVNNQWMECDDLKSSPVSFTSLEPMLNSRDIHLLVYEAKDSCGKMLKCEETTNHLFQEPMLIQEEDNEVIDLIDTDDDCSELGDNKSISSGDHTFSIVLENSNTEENTDIVQASQQETELTHLVDTEDDGPPKLTAYNVTDKLFNTDITLGFQQEMELDHLVDTEDDGPPKLTAYNYSVSPADKHTDNMLIPQQDMELADLVDIEGDGPPKLTVNSPIYHADQLFPLADAEDALQLSLAEDKEIITLPESYCPTMSDIHQSSALKSYDFVNLKVTKNGVQILPDDYFSSTKTDHSTECSV